MHQRNHDYKAVIYTAANIFQRLDILARDVIELEKQYVCTYKAYAKSRTSTVCVALSLDQHSYSISVQFHYIYSYPRCLLYCIVRQLGNVLMKTLILLNII